MATRKICFRVLLGCLCSTLFAVVILDYYFEQTLEEFDYIIENDYPGKERQELVRNPSVEAQVIPHPILLWWTPFTLESGAVRQCGKHKCFFTNNRQFFFHNSTKGLFFYGSDFDILDLPLPRQSHHEWALLHEESPKNVFYFSHDDIMSLFNHTCTFREESDFPISTQYLSSIKDLETLKYLVPTSQKTQLVKDGKRALVNYVQSDCGTPSDRDTLVQMLQKHLKVDSYGQCEHNKDLPKHLKDPIKGMAHEDFYQLLAQYKFTLALENAICQQYITEKFWRPFKLGSVPIIFESPKIREYLPSPKSAIIVDDFKNIKELADYLIYLDSNDTAYNEYHEFKRTGLSNVKLRELMEHRNWGCNEDWTNPNFIEKFECFVCERVNENLKNQQARKKPSVYQANKSHYGCPIPTKFVDPSSGSLQRAEHSWWWGEWETTRKQAAAFRSLLANGVSNITQKAIMEKMKELKLQRGG